MAAQQRRSSLQRYMPQREYVKRPNGTALTPSERKRQADFDSLWIEQVDPDTGAKFLFHEVTGEVRLEGDVKRQHEELDRQAAELQLRKEEQGAAWRKQAAMESNNMYDPAPVSYTHLTLPTKA